MLEALIKPPVTDSHRRLDYFGAPEAVPFRTARAFTTGKHMPKFSVIIPTRLRPDTLRSALRTAVDQTYSDIEILVQECGDDPASGEAVAAVGDGRTRHLKTGELVPMSENWERAVAAATGDYITIIGDDDGILPEACSQAAALLERNPVELLTWRPAAYFWPRSTVAQLRNRLQAFLPRSGCEQQDPQVLLELAYRFRNHHYTLPMILHSFVSRELIDRVKQSYGSYFHSPAPDIASGVVDALVGRSCLLAHQPLSISGLSHHSTGSRLHFNRDAGLRREAETAAFAGLTFHPTLVNSRNSQLFAANEMMTLKQRLFADRGPDFDYRNLLQRALDTLTTGLEDYGSGLQDIRRIAERNGISMEDFFIPPAPSGQAPAPQGVRALGPGSLLVDVDCQRAGLHDVAGATRLMAALLPPLEIPSELPPPPPPQVRELSSGSPDMALSFNRSGNGLLLLGSGWGQPEEWGVWSIAKRADVSWRLQGALNRPLTIKVEGRMFVPPGGSKGTGSISIDGRRLGELRADAGNPAVTGQVQVMPSDIAGGTLRLEFEADSPASPSSYGISADSRCLGFGLERLVVQ